MQVSTANAAGAIQAGGRPPGPPPGGPQKAAMESAAESLGLSETELREQLMSGETLAGLAEDAGLDVEELKATMAAAIEEVAPAQVAERMIGELDSVIAGDRPSGPPPPPPDAGQALEDLASALDLSSEDLLSAIEDGTFAELLKSEGVEQNRGNLIDAES